MNGRNVKLNNQRNYARASRGREVDRKKDRVDKQIYEVRRTEV
jgi:hypothetical protein